MKPNKMSKDTRFILCLHMIDCLSMVDLEKAIEALTKLAEAQ